MGVVLPTVERASVDLLWFEIFIVLVVEMAQITPPEGINLFVLQGMTRHEITWIARQAFPMFLLIIAALLPVHAFPGWSAICRSTCAQGDVASVPFVRIY